MILIYNLPQGKRKETMDEVNKITNRHIAKLLNRIRQVVELPQIIEDDIIRQMHFLKEDLTKELSENEPKNNTIF